MKAQRYNETTEHVTPQTETWDLFPVYVRKKQFIFHIPVEFETIFSSSCNLRISYNASVSVHIYILCTYEIYNAVFTTSHHN